MSSKVKPDPTAAPTEPCERHPLACPMALSCPMCDDFEYEATLRIWQINDCDRDSARCARHKVRETGAILPRGLRPDGNVRRLRERDPDSP